MAPVTAGVPINAVSPGSGAATAGLHPGDRLLRVGATAVATPDQANRALDALRAAPTFLVFERDGVTRGVLVAPPSTTPSATGPAPTPVPTPAPTPAPARRP